MKSELSEVDIDQLASLARNAGASVQLDTSDVTVLTRRGDRGISQPSKCVAVKQVLSLVKF